jgi:hypothetical protein
MKYLKSLELARILEKELIRYIRRCIGQQIRTLVLEFERRDLQEMRTTIKIFQKTSIVRKVQLMK